MEDEKLKPERRKSRRSDKREAMRRVFEANHHPMTVEEIHLAAKGQISSIGIATIYRNLRLFQEEGLIRPVEIPGESARYEWCCDRHAHTHFICDECDRSFCVDEQPTQLEMNLPQGFEMKHMDVFLHGICPGLLE